MRIILAQLVIVFGLVALSSPPTLANAKTRRLVRVLQTDSSFKVRLKALRVLAKQMKKSPATKSSKLIQVIGQAVSEDDHYLVRGMACFILGQVAASGGREYLEKAKNDPQPFVRVQAESALRAIADSSPADQGEGIQLTGTSTASPPLVFTVEAMPGANIPKTMIDQMAQRMGENLKRVSDSRFSFHSELEQGRLSAKANQQRSSGFKIRSSIAQRSLKRVHGRELHLTIVVRVTITTWPENNLRHIISAEATGKLVTADPDAIKRVEAQVLQGAVDQAIADIMKEISRS